MKKICLFTLLMATGATSFAQMKIGGSSAPPDGSAYLQLGDIDANKGLLHARVNLLSTTTWGLANAQPVEGMEVFNINPNITGAGANGTGLYVWKNNQWNALGAGTTASNNYWSLGGNTTGAMKNLGTLDNYALPFITNGTEKMRITADGKVGIGVANPLFALALPDGTGAKLSIRGNGSGTPSNDNQFMGFGTGAGLFYSQIDATSDAFAWRAGTSTTGSNTLMTLRGNGNLGVGTDNPATKLDVNGTGLFRNGNVSNSFANNQLLFGWSGAPQYQHAIKTRHCLGASAGNSIDFYVWKDGTDAVGAVGTQHVMTLDGGNNGSVGIGTTAPTAKLEVNSGAANQSGLKFSKLNTSSPATSGASYLGVDGSGNVVVAPAPASAPTPAPCPTATYGKNCLGSYLTVCGSNANVVSITLPAAGTYMITYTLSADATSCGSSKAIAFLNTGNSCGSSIPCSETIAAMGSNYVGGSGTATVFYTATSPTTIYLGVKTQGSFYVETSSDWGSTSISYLKIAN